MNIYGTKAGEIRNDWKYLAKMGFGSFYFVKYMGPWNVLCQLPGSSVPGFGSACYRGAGMGDVWVSCHFKVTLPMFPETARVSRA